MSNAVYREEDFKERKELTDKNGLFVGIKLIVPCLLGYQQATVTKLENGEPTVENEGNAFHVRYAGASWVCAGAFNKGAFHLLKVLKGEEDEG